MDSLGLQLKVRLPSSAASAGLFICVDHHLGVCHVSLANRDATFHLYSLRHRRDAGLSQGETEDEEVQDDWGDDPISSPAAALNLGAAWRSAGEARSTASCHSVLPRASLWVRAWFCVASAS